MTLFAAKAAPTPEKLRGGYYTPEPIAKFVAQWVAAAGPRLLEPSCGDGNILAFLAEASSEAVGIELFPNEAEAAERRTGASVIAGDFFEWFDESRLGAFDGVAGNPPYIRFGNWEEKTREVALGLMRSQGLRPSKLTNAWVPFVVASLMAVRPGGRVGLVLPAELLQVGYAGELRKFLIANSASISIVTFRQLVFPGILQEIVVLLAERGTGPAQVRVHELDRGLDLANLRPDATEPVRAPLDDSEKWTKYFLSADQIELLRRMRSDSRLSRLDEFASVDVGVVTGRNGFFVMTEAQAVSRSIRDLTIPLVAKSAQVTGIRYSTDDHLQQAQRDLPTLLLDARGIDPRDHPGLANYIREGEAHEVHTGYKCRIRKQWWVVPSIWRADAFMLRQIHKYPRIIANETMATSTDTVHRMRMKGSSSASKLAVAAFNSITFAITEVAGRSYGGGILELEPSEAEDLRLPSPGAVPDDLVAQVDALIRGNQVDAALDLVDSVVLVGALGMNPADLREARLAWRRLRDRRTGRGAGKTA